MLTTYLLHPELLAALGGAGHGSRVLIADGNYPFSTGSNPSARRVFLNLRPGLVSALDVLEALVKSIPVESAMVMVPPEGPQPPIQADMRRLLPADVPMEKKGRMEFYAEAKSPDTALVIATGEQRIYANILLVIGVVKPA
ncbi:MAG TPA: RbsD/FucU family protein [Spirochaetia bacterium]|nr:RbsD/FucU family protein [Spirochaetia bacterium]HTZ52265.1 RbsD/FucU family protein [Spirochaetia bacterium]